MSRIEVKYVKPPTQEEVFTTNQRSQARKVWKMCEQAKAGLESGAEAKGRSRKAVWNWGIAGTFIVTTNLLSDVHDTFVFSANI